MIGYPVFGYERMLDLDRLAAPIAAMSALHP
jgi:hypothetical protein